MPTESLFWDKRAGGGPLPPALVLLDEDACFCGKKLAGIDGLVADGTAGRGTDGTTETGRAGETDAAAAKASPFGSDRADSVGEESGSWGDDFARSPLLPLVPSAEAAVVARPVAAEPPVPLKS